MSKPYRTEQPATKRREVYEPDEIRKVIAACPDSPSGTRDRLAVMLLWCAGLKPHELVELHADHFVRRTGCVRMPWREFAVVVPSAQRPNLWAFLGEWKAHRRRVAKPDSPLLCNLMGDQMDKSYLRHVLAQLAKTAAVTRPLTAQGFRNTFAAAMHRSRVPMEVIRRQLGLSDLEYTAAYLARIAPIEQHEAMEDFRLE